VARYNSFFPLFPLPYKSLHPASYILRLFPYNLSFKQQRDLEASHKHNTVLRKGLAVSFLKLHHICLYLNDPDVQTHMELKINYSPNRACGQVFLPCYVQHHYLCPFLHYSCTHILGNDTLENVQSKRILFTRLLLSPPTEFSLVGISK
jgi:hypothetical protein